MSEQPTKFCKDCANFKAPGLCYVGQKTNVVNGEIYPCYLTCAHLRAPYCLAASFKGDDYGCGPDARRFTPIDPAKAPKHRSFLGFILGHK